jgi:hypothetical protein
MGRSMIRVAALAAFMLAAPAVARGPIPLAASSPARERTVIAVGDLIDCTDPSERKRARAVARDVARMVAREPGAVVATLGDNVYRADTGKEYRDCFNGAWGSLRNVTHPAPGNHDYADPDASGYFQTFGSRAGTRGEGYYAYSLGDWRVLVLNTNDGACRFVACDGNSGQLAWAREELAKTGEGSCVLAYWHHPRFSSGAHGDSRWADDLWRTLADGGVDVVLNGHDHHYERFAPMDTDGKADPAGMRSFIVGTGGGEHYPIQQVSPNSEVRETGVTGALRLTLRPYGYDWSFEATPGLPGSSFDDHGSGACH